MRALSIASLVLLASGCTLLLAPNRDAIVDDLDADIDAGDGGIDGGPDAGDSGPPCTPVAEVCANGRDDDCDERTDCFDSDCVADERCCRTGTTPERSCLASTLAFRRVPMAAESEIRFSDALCNDATRLTEFGPLGRTRALITDECQPINFGMRFETTFLIQTACAGTCDHAALAFTRLQTIADDTEPLLSELRVVVASDGSARVERGGAVLLDASGQPVARPARHFVAGVPIRARVELWPGPDESGFDVLFATVDLDQMGASGSSRLLNRRPVMPLEDLRCVRPAGSEAGLYAAIEGTGSSVQMQGPLTRVEHECSNPSQFRPQQAVDTSALTACAPGGVGAPAMASYCRASCGSTAASQFQWDVWVDASSVPRTDDGFRFVDFGICGYAAERPQFPSGADGDRWVERRPPGFLWSIPPSSREPTLLPVYDDDDDETRVDYLWYAFAQRTEPNTEVYAIHGGRVFRDPLEPPGTARPIFGPDDTDRRCHSLRDPLLVARHAASGTGHRVSGSWLFFTCERNDGMPKSIGVVRLDSELRRVGSMAIVLTSEVGPYASRGVFAPEGFALPSASETTLRLWFLTRDAQGAVRLAFARGRAALSTDAPPALEPYPANPILEARSPILGDDCGGACALTGLSVTPSLAERGNYQFLVSRSRTTAAGTVHELVPLLQPAPPD